MKAFVVFLMVVTVNFFPVCSMGDEMEYAREQRQLREAQERVYKRRKEAQREEARIKAEQRQKISKTFALVEKIFELGRVIN